MTVTAIALLAFFVLAAGIHAWRKRRRIRRAIEAIADQFGLRRLPGESDEELRARCFLLLSHSPGSSRTTIEGTVRDMLWYHGYRRADVIAAALEPGRITVRILSPRVPARVLQVVRDEVADMIPCGTILEIHASKRWAS